MRQSQIRKVRPDRSEEKIFVDRGVIPIISIIRGKDRRDVDLQIEKIKGRYNFPVTGFTYQFFFIIQAHHGK